MKKNHLMLLPLVTLLLTGCGGNKNRKQDKSAEEIGYNYTDPTKPIVKDKNQVSYDVTGPKNSLALNYNEMLIFQNLENQTNVVVRYNNLSEGQYETQKQLILADRDNLPDALYHAGFTNKELVQYGSNRKTIVAIDEYLQYMPNMTRILTARPDIRAALESPDGHIYSLPRIEEMGLKSHPNLLFINKQWIGKLIDENRLSFNLEKSALVDGLKLKRSQLKEILGQFKSLDMNGNGSSSDEIPMSFVSGNWQGNQSDLFSSFGFPENADHKTIINNQTTFTVQNPLWRKAASEIALWVKDGLIETAAFEDGQDAFLAKGKVDSAGYERLGCFYWWEMETVISAQEQANYICMQPLVDDDTNKQYVGVSNLQEVEKGEIVVFSKTANKEVLLTYFDRFYEPYTSAQLNYGPIGIVFEEQLDANNKLVTAPVPEGKTVDELRLKNAPMGALCLTQNEWDHYVNMEPRAVLRLQRLDAYEKPYTVENVKGFPNISYTVNEINELAKYEQGLSDLIASNYTKWMIGGKAITDDEWNKFQSDLVKAGLETVKQINQTGYERYLASVSK